jgi:WD40 repeat protein
LRTQRVPWIVLTILAWVPSLGPGQSAAGREPGPAEAEKQKRVDRLGDPLPPGVIARLGTLRLRYNAYSLAWSPDGALLATAREQSNVRVWDTRTGMEVERFKDIVDARVVAFSHDGKVLLTARGGGFIQQWDVAKGVLLRQHNVVPDNFSGYCVMGEFSHDRKLLALSNTF